MCGFSVIVIMFKLIGRFGMANESTPIALTDVNCHKSTLLHLMRCSFNEPGNSDIQQQSGCDHTKDVVVYCGEWNIILN